MIVDNREINMIAFAPCPMERPLLARLNILLEEHKLKTGEELVVVLPSFSEDRAKYDNFTDIKSMEMLPDVIISMGFGDFMKSEFIKKFANTENFAGFADERMNENFQNDGYIDKIGCYRLVSSFPYVFLADRRELGKLPAPAGWTDILDDKYTKKIAVSGKDGIANDAVLFTIFKYFGEDGIKKLARNVIAVEGYSKIVNDMAGKKDKPAVYAIPYHFALKDSTNDGMELIWPEDGAILEPVYMLVKKIGLKRAEVLALYITGKDFGELAAGMGFPSQHIDVDNRLPEGAGFKWVGWDFIRNNDIHRLKKNLADIFRNAK